MVERAKPLTMGEIFGELDGHVYSVRQLRDEIARIHSKHRQQFHGGFGVDEVMDFFHQFKWLVELQSPEGPRLAVMIP